MVTRFEADMAWLDTATVDGRVIASYPDGTVPTRNMPIPVLGLWPGGRELIGKLTAAAAHGNVMRGAGEVWDTGRGTEVVRALDAGLRLGCGVDLGLPSVNGGVPQGTPFPFRGWHLSGLTVYMDGTAAAWPQAQLWKSMAQEAVTAASPGNSHDDPRCPFTPGASRHGHTHHGHPCCALAPGKPPGAISRCGGPAICAPCALRAAGIHREPVCVCGERPGRERGNTADAAPQGCAA